MKLSFKIAARFLKSSKGQTILIALGIAIGVSVQIFIGSLIQGLQKGLVNKTIGNSSQITILSSKEDKTINNWEEIINKIKSSDNRVIKVSPSADSSGFIKLEDKAEPVLMRGFQFENADKIYNLKNRIYKGKMPQND
ncbi:MAG: ABC transporter permease, partial [Clostridium sp.]|nr:ABC transporter permease [Clostridium sp.]